MPSPDRLAHTAFDSTAGTDQGVAEVIGTILLVTLTVTMAGGVALFASDLYRQDEGRTHADLSVSILVGQACAGGEPATGDERIVLEHHGGDALTTATTDVRVLWDQRTLVYRDANLGDGFDDGRLSIGERWVTPNQLAIAPGQTVTVDVVHNDQLLLSTELVGPAEACGGGTS